MATYIHAVCYLKNINSVKAFRQCHMTKLYSTASRAYSIFYVQQAIPQIRKFLFIFNYTCTWWPLRHDNSANNIFRPKTLDKFEHDSD